jgi:hypothetical protein
LSGRLIFELGVDIVAAYLKFLKPLSRCLNSDHYKNNMITEYSARLLSLFLCLSVLLPRVAAAGTLKLEGEPEIQAQILGDEVVLRVSAPITNRGDENSKEVFPWFQLGGAVFAGDPKMLAQGQSYVWELERRYPLAKIQCESDKENSCAGMNLPSKGAFPLFIRRHYQDMNGAAFSAPSVAIVRLGELTEEERLGTQDPPLTFQSSAGSLRGGPTGGLGIYCESSAPLFSARGLDWEGSHLTFHCSGMLQNRSRTPIKVALSAFSTRELRVITPPQLLTLEADRSVPFSLEVENSSGLLGSTYPVYFVAQWGEGNIRQTRQTFGLVSIQKSDRFWLLTGFGLLVFALLSLLMYVFVFIGGGERKRKGTPK